MNYCDYNVEKAEVFITQTQLLTMFKDARIITAAGLSQNDLCVAIQKVLKTKTYLIKTISFTQFLDCVMAVAEQKER